jgi:hypothetical protein
MKKVIIFCLLINFISCSKDKDEPTIDLDLLYGQWFSSNACATQNSLVFNSDGTYVRRYSGNTCDNNVNDTYQYEGRYIINGNNIRFNQQSETIVEEGDVTSSLDFEDIELISQKIVLLTDTELIIQQEFDREPIFRNWQYNR